MPRVETKPADELEPGDVLNIHPEGNRDWRVVINACGSPYEDEVIDVEVEGIKYPISILADDNVEVNVTHPDE